jgi:hypothetical protein
MTGLALIIFGVYMVAVGYHDNGSTSLQFISTQKGYIPWIVAILILWALYQVKTVRPFIGAIAGLLIVALIVKNFPAIKTQYQNIIGG